jgi:hypothetical protein
MARRPGVETMSLETLIAALVGLIGALATVVAALLPPYLSQRRARHAQQYKLGYMKVHLLKLRANGGEPFYEREVERLDRRVGVFSEVHCYRLHIFSTEQREFTCSDRSSGVVDLLILHPDHQMSFPDRRAAKVEGFIEQKITEPSKVFFSRTVYVNGFQPGNEDIGMKMEKDTNEAKLIVDFTSVPGYRSLIKGHPRGVLCCGTTEGPLAVAEPTPGVYAVGKNKLKKDDVLRIDFDVDWGAVRGD